MRVKPSKEPYKFVCVFRGKQVVEEREYSSDEEELNIVPRLLWPEDQSPNVEPDSNQDLEGVYLPEQEGEPASSTQDENGSRTVLDIRRLLRSHQSYEPQEDATKPEACNPATLEQEAIPHTPDQPLRQPDSPLTHSQHTPARHPPEPSTPPRQDRDDESPGTIRRGYYSETILVEEQDTGEPLGIEEAEDMKNPFLDDEEEHDAKNKEEEERDRIRRYLDARDKLGYVIRGNKFPIPPELYEDGSPTTTRGAAVLWPKARALTRHPSPPPPPPPPSLEIIQQPQQQSAPPPFDSGTPIFAPPPKITWRKIISTPGDDFDDPRAFYYPPFENNHYSFDGAGSSSYGSETKHSSAPVATVYKEHNSTVSKLSVQIQRPEKHALEDDDEGICDVHADEEQEQEQEILVCNSFDGCWGLRKHIVSIYFWRAAERESFEERTDKLLILR